MTATPNSTETPGFLTPVSSAPAYDLDLAKQLQATISGITGIDGSLVRPRWQPVPPKQPLDRTISWCAVGVMSQVNDTNPTVVHDSSGDGSSIYYLGEELTILASFYGPSCAGNAALLRDGLNVGQNRWAMRALGLAYVVTERVTTVPELTNEEWINRVDMSFRVRRRVARRYLINNILSAEGTLTIEGGGVSGPMIDTPSFTAG